MLHLCRHRRPRSYQAHIPHQHIEKLRQFVERNQGKKQYDLIFGDAFNDFSVPWHLTTQQFNQKLATMLAPDGVYMINIIDAYESEAEAARDVHVRGVR